ncbi:MAG: hypothetical protein GY723_19545 [bacterium]|nr:hypothetical protein [bacterium]MCP5067954.1 hypothetical protein [bacterium]
MRIHAILRLLAPFALVALLAGSATAEDITLVCHGSDCEIVRDGAPLARGTYSRAIVTTHEPAPGARPTYEPTPEIHWSPGEWAVLPNVGHRRYLRDRAHRHHRGFGHRYRPQYRYSYGHHDAHRHHDIRRDSYRGRRHYRSFGIDRHRRGTWTGRRHDRRSDSNRSRGHRESRRRHTRF